MTTSPPRTETNGAGRRTAPAHAAPHVGAGLPPGPRIPRIAQSAGWLFWPIEFMETCRRRYGSTFTLRLADMPPIVVIGEPAAVKEIFTGDPDVFHAGLANAILKPILGASSLLLL